MPTSGIVFFSENTEQLLSLETNIMLPLLYKLAYTSRPKKKMGYWLPALKLEISE